MLLIFAVLFAVLCPPPLLFELSSQGKLPTRIARAFSHFCLSLFTFPSFLFSFHPRLTWEDEGEGKIERRGDERLCFFVVTTIPYLLNPLTLSNNTHIRIRKVQQYTTVSICFIKEQKADKKNRARVYLCFKCISVSVTYLQLTRFTRKQDLR